MKTARRTFGLLPRSFDYIRQSSRRLLQPLSLRERITYSGLVICILALVIAPRVVANNGDVGSIFSVASSLCSSTETWLNPEQVVGLHSVPDGANRNQLDTTNSAVWTGNIGQLECAGFVPPEDHNYVSNAVSLSLRARSVLPGESTLTEQSNTNSVNLLDGTVLSERIEYRPELIEPNANAATNQALDIDTLLVLYISDDNGESWMPLHNFDRGLISQTTSRFEIAFPNKYVRYPDRLAFKLESVATLEGVEVLLDGMNWTYSVGQDSEVSGRLLQKDSSLAVTDDVPVINEVADLRFEINIKDHGDGFWQGVRSTIGGDEAQDPAVTATLLNKDGSPQLSKQLETEFIDTDLSNKRYWITNADVIEGSLDPGRYTLELEVSDNAGHNSIITQDFVWGVLALNTDKSNYTQNDTAQLMMSVLDELGETVCDAQVELAIRGPNVSRTLSTADDSITISDTCSEYGAHLTADYQAAFAFREIGEYELTLSAKTANGEYSIAEKIHVAESPIYQVQREGPTRIFPILDYPMRMTITAENGYRGLVRETVPASFTIRPDGNSLGYDSVTESEGLKTIEWPVVIEAGQSITVGYQFDAPDISPEFYTLGPLELVSYEQVIFSEQRAWQLAGDVVGRMILFFDGASIPSGWTCISCSSGDDFYQRFIKGAATYGGTGGAATHTHTATTNVGVSTAASTESGASNNISDVAHSHGNSTTLGSPSNLPSYRQLRVIRRNITGHPTTIPSGAIAIFDTTTMPSGWTRYSAQDGAYIRGENTSGTTGGNNTHTVSISGTLNAATTTNDVRSRGGGSQTTGAISGHTHTFSGTSASASNEPSYIEVVLGKISSDGAVPTGMISMWDNEAPSGWNSWSDTGDAFNARYLKPANGYGTTGGTNTHSHTNTSLTSSQPSGSTSARSGAQGATTTHTHTVNITSYSSVNHEPPYREAFFARYNPVTTYEQASYRFYENDNSTDVGTALAAQNTTASIPQRGTAFRLRMNLHISVVELAQNGQNFKLQYALRSGTCDIGFSGESYADVGTASGAIRYFDNPTPTDNDALTGNANDPSHSSDTINDQSYEESNNFTNSQSAIPVGEDGLWDFSLVDINAEYETNYCFRVVKSDGSELATYTVIPEVLTAAAPPKMILLFDGVSIPSGWTCISCSSGDDVYQRLIRGEATYGGTGGTSTHSHTASGSVATTLTAPVAESQPGAGVSTPTHSHTYTPTIDPASNLPAYRQLNVIQYDAGTPSTIPSGAIGLFTTTTMPTDFSRYSAQDGNFVYGENTVGTTGGSNTHTNGISGTTSTSSNITTTNPRTNGPTQADATDAHDHTISGATGSVDHQPPFIEMVLGQATTDTAIPNSIITMWSEDPGGTWTCVSCTSGDDLYQRFFKPANGYGTTGGSSSHSHADVTGISSGGANQTFTGRDGATGDGGSHTHSVNVTGISTDSHLPPYINVTFYQAPANNTAPNAPTALDQVQTNLTTIAVGDWTNETTVRFEAQLSDPDNPDSIALCVEAKPVGTSFSNTEDSCGTLVAYSGSAVDANVSISGLTDGENYHWQARAKDSTGAYSSWVSFGANAESATDFRIDATVPTGTVYDGTTVSVDIDYNDGSLDAVDGNWDVDSSASGLSGYEYSVGTVAGATDVVGWTSNGTSTSITAASASLQTSQVYYLNVRATDNAGNQAIISSDGFLVAPTLSFTTTPDGVDFGNVNPGNSFTATSNTTLTTSTNAYNGYVVRAYAQSLLTSGANTIAMFDGGTYASPDGWQTGDRGFGYTSSDTLVQGTNKFNPATCAGGNPSPCYAPFSLTAPGDIIADHTSTVSGTAITNEQFTITQRVTVDDSYAPGDYTTILIYNVTAEY